MSNNGVGRFVAALAAEGRVRVMVVEARGPAEELRVRHGLSGQAAEIAAEGLVASLLLSAHVKGDERLTVDVRGAKPSFAFLCDVNGDGTLRARFNPAWLAEGKTGPSFDGMMSVLKSLGPRELYRGVAEVRDESFERALLRYLLTSQQVDGRVRLAARLGPDGRVAAAAGILVERLPDLDPQDFADRFDAALTGDFEDLITGAAFGVLGQEPYEVIGTRDVEYKCTCTKERVVNVLRSLGAEEVASILAEQGQAEVTCHYCNERYLVDADGLAALLLELGGAPA